MISTLLRCLLLLALITPMHQLSAQTTRYVTDQLEITMRNGQGVEFGIRRMLPAGAQLEVLENDPDGYSRVRTADGIEGWVLSRYLSRSPSARDQLAEREERIANLELEIAEYKEELENISGKHAEADGENAGLRERASRLRRELEDLRQTASSAVAIENENRQLKTKLQQLDDANQALEIENSALKENETRDWFLLGAGVLFGGIILGLILPSLRLRRKNNWSQF